MAEQDDQNPLPAPSALDTSIQKHPIAALLGAFVIGIVLAKIVF